MRANTLIPFVFSAIAITAIVAGVRNAPDPAPLPPVVSADEWDVVDEWDGTIGHAMFLMGDHDYFEAVSSAGE